jgi:YVTN family beta-propeller protein
MTRSMIPTRTALAVMLAAVVTTGCGAAYRKPTFVTPQPTNPVKFSKQGELRDVVLAGNNWAGTVTVFDPVSFQTLAVIDVIPDWDKMVAQIKDADVTRRAAFKLIRQVAGEGNHQLVDDVFLSHDGNLLFASRPSLADVIAIELDTNTIKWRQPVDGVRADHAALSPDGKTLLVSASTAGKVHAFDTETGKVMGFFKSGDEPHESNYSIDGSKIYHASIGRVFLPAKPNLSERLKGERVFQIVDAKSYEVIKKYDMREKTKEAGEEWIHASVRPMTLAPDGRFIYFQMSFYHGFFEFDLEKEAITRRVELTIPAAVKKLSLNDYQLNSAHHGIAMNGAGTKLCVAGTMSDYAAIVDRASLRHSVIPIGPKPYWSTASADGRHCYLSVSGEDRVVVIDFETEKEVGRIAVGKHPQRVRTGKARIAAGSATK